MLTEQGALTHTNTLGLSHCHLRTMLVQKHHQDLQNCPDFRPLWKTVFAFRWQRLHRLVSFYLSLECGSCQLERDLGQLACLSEARCGAAQSDCVDLERCLEITLDGASSETEMFERRVVEAPLISLTSAIGIPAFSPSKPVLSLTTVSREFCNLWIEYYGRRFHLYKKRADTHQKKGHREGSEAATVTAQKRCRDLLVQTGGIDRCLLGMASGEFAVGKDLNDHHLTSEMKSFKKRSDEIRIKALQVKQRVFAKEKHYPPGWASRSVQSVWFASLSNVQTLNRISNPTPIRYNVVGMLQCQAQSAEAPPLIHMASHRCPSSQDEWLPLLCAVVLPSLIDAE